MTKARVFCDVNPTPIFRENPEYVDDGTKAETDKKGRPRFVRNFPASDYLRTRGVESIFSVYEGTLNGAPMWSDNGVPRAGVNGRVLDWSKVAHFGGTVDEQATKACARLALNPNLYAVPNTPALNPYLPIVFDLEPGGVGYDLNTPRSWPAAYENILKLLTWSREVNPKSALAMLWTFPFGRDASSDAFWRTDAMREILGRINYLNPTLYFTEVAWPSTTYIFDQADYVLSACRKYAPEIPVLVTVNPTYQLYGDQTGNPKNGTRVEESLWRRFLRYLVDRDCHIEVWHDGTIAAATTANLNIAADLNY
jgi:hypothetical protein